MGRKPALKIMDIAGVCPKNIRAFFISANPHSEHGTPDMGSLAIKRTTRMRVPD
jgi:hypothetical protein